MIINVGTSDPRQFCPQWIWAQFLTYWELVFLMFSGQLLRSGLAAEEQPYLPWMPMLLPEVYTKLLKNFSRKLIIRRDSPYPAHALESREPCAEGQNWVHTESVRTSEVQLPT